MTVFSKTFKRGKNAKRTDLIPYANCEHVTEVLFYFARLRENLLWPHPQKKDLGTF